MNKGPNRYCRQLSPTWAPGRSDAQRLDKKGLSFLHVEKTNEKDVGQVSAEFLGCYERLCQDLLVGAPLQPFKFIPDRPLHVTR
jgi:hypothetical protein